MCVLSLSGCKVISTWCLQKLTSLHLPTLASLVMMSDSIFTTAKTVCCRKSSMFLFNDGLTSTSLEFTGINYTLHSIFIYSTTSVTEQDLKWIMCYINLYFSIVQYCIATVNVKWWCQYVLPYCDIVWIWGGKAPFNCEVLIKLTVAGVIDPYSPTKYQYE